MKNRLISLFDGPLQRVDRACKLPLHTGEFGQAQYGQRAVRILFLFLGIEIFGGHPEPLRQRGIAVDGRRQLRLLMDGVQAIALVIQLPGKPLWCGPQLNI